MIRDMIEQSKIDARQALRAGRVACLTFARLNSQRVSRKLLKTIGGQSLLERGMRYMGQLAMETGAVPIIVTGSQDQETVDAIHAVGVQVLTLTEGEDLPTTEDFDSHAATIAAQLDALGITRVWSNNCLTHPFQRIDTGKRLLTLAAGTTDEFVLTAARRGLVWGADGGLLQGHGQHANTKTNPVYHDLSHLGYLVSTRFFSTPEAEAAPQIKPLAVDQTWYERIDIDTWDDLQHAGAVASLADALRSADGPSRFIFQDAGIGVGR